MSSLRLRGREERAGVYFLNRGTTLIGSENTILPVAPKSIETFAQAQWRGNQSASRGPREWTLPTSSRGIVGRLARRGCHWISNELFWRRARLDEIFYRWQSELCGIWSRRIFHQVGGSIPMVSNSAMIYMTAQSGIAHHRPVVLWRALERTMLQAGELASCRQH